MIIKYAKEVLKIEADSISNLIERVGDKFEQAVQLILSSKGRVILTGIGKSGLVAKKISATLSSTGTPSMFLHPAEAIHGDLGMVTSSDIVIALSNSGHTSEIKAILPVLKAIGAKIIAFTGNPSSPLAIGADLIIDVSVEREACPMGLAPTASTTAALAMGDALAVALMNMRHFSPDDFKRLHPGGSLGDRLGAKVKEVMNRGDKIPFVKLGSYLKDAIPIINEKDLGAAVIVDANGILKGIITDGDLRRILIERDSIKGLLVDDVMSDSPRTIDEDQSTAEALGIMELYVITLLVIIDYRNMVKGVVHLHDVLGRGELRIHTE